MWLTLVILALAGAWRVGNNTFSMHHFYRSRLIRCYLDASAAHSLTDTANLEGGSGDILLSNFGTTKFDGPLRLLNASLNISEGNELAWQDRKAISFCFSPLFRGYSRRAAGSNAEAKPAYQCTRS